MRKIGSVFLVLGFCLVGTAGNATHILELPGGPNSHKIELVSSNVFDGTFYVWTYDVTSGGGSTVHGLSHWVFDFCLEYFDHATDEGGTNISIKTALSPDPTLGIPGLKFDDEYDDNEERTVMIYLTKAVEITQSQVGIKSGGNKYYGYIDAPSCVCVDESVPEPSTMALIGAGFLVWLLGEKDSSKLFTDIS